MGATSAQGWYMFVFLVGFTLGPAGLYAFGWPVALVGFALIGIALAGFRSIKEPVVDDPVSVQHAPAESTLRPRAAKNY